MAERLRDPSRLICFLWKKENTNSWLKTHLCPLEKWCRSWLRGGAPYRKMNVCTSNKKQRRTNYGTTKKLKFGTITSGTIQCLCSTGRKTKNKFPRCTPNRPNMQPKWIARPVNSHHTNCKLQQSNFNLKVSLYKWFNSNNNISRCYWLKRKNSNKAW